MARCLSWGRATFTVCLFTGERHIRIVPQWRPSRVHLASISRSSRRAGKFGARGGYIGVLILGRVIAQILHEGVVTELHLAEAISAAAHVDAETGGVGRCGRAKEAAGALRRCGQEATMMGVNRSLGSPSCPPLLWARAWACHRLKLCTPKWKTTAVCTCVHTPLTCNMTP